MDPKTASLAALALLLMAGCTGETGPATDTPLDSHGNPVPPPVQIPAPVWKVGQSWTYSWLIEGDPNPFDVQSVVAEATPAGYLLATPSLASAAIHGAFTLPTLGLFSPTDLTASADGGTWPWYRFPLSENLTWQASLSSKDGEGGTYQQTWAMAASNVTSRGADIVARVDGVVIAQYDFDNATGWFTEARFYSEEGDLQFHITLKEKAATFQGTLYDATGDFLFQADFAAEPGTFGGQPTAQFSPDADHTHILAFPYAYAAGGASASTLVAPNGTAYPLHTDPAQAVDGTGTGAFLVVPAAPGNWEFATVGAGAFAWGGGVQAFGISARVLTV
ncbi:MAG: hypothetical protein QOD77_110 [Thermoplasmata archaeon]|jgi:hypothetical protein|nr:hypothetical protein [Thermoplasmata archaeon]